MLVQAVAIERETRERRNDVVIAEEPQIDEQQHRKELRPQDRSRPGRKCNHRRPEREGVVERRAANPPVVAIGDGDALPAESSDRHGS